MAATVEEPKDHEIEVLMDFSDENESFVQNEKRFVTKSRCEYFCQAGWVKDLTGGNETMKHNSNDVVLKIDNVQHTSNVEDVSNA